MGRKLRDGDWLHLIGMLFLTPTCVGNTSRKNIYTKLLQDHPHMRGEYRTSCTGLATLQGSPPHAWGIPKPLFRLSKRTRITPTCVRNTLVHHWDRPGWWDHPHMRGEYPSCLKFGYSFKGSPPHAWGIPPYRKQLEALKRITPTCVGNTDAG